MDTLLESQVFGVGLGAVIALGATLIADWLRTRREDQRRADRGRVEVHIDALKAAYALRDAAIHLDIVNDHGKLVPRKSRLTVRDSAYDRFDAAGHDVGKQLQVVVALGHPAVAAALRLVADCAHSLILDPDTTATFADLDESIALLASAIRTEARVDEFIRNGGNLSADLRLARGEVGGRRRSAR